MRKRIIAIVCVTLILVIISVIIPSVFIEPKTLYDASFKNWEEYDFNYYIGWEEENCEEKDYNRGTIVDWLKQEEACGFFSDVDGIRVARYYGVRNDHIFSDELEYSLVINHFNKYAQPCGMMWQICFYRNGRVLAPGFYNPQDKHSIFEASIYYSDLMVNYTDYRAFAEKYFEINDIGGQTDE